VSASAAPGTGGNCAGTYYTMQNSGVVGVRGMPGPIHGDAELFALTKKLDGCDLEKLEVHKKEWDAACDRVPNTLSDLTEPSSGGCAFYLVAGVSGGVEGSLGTRSDGTELPSAGVCISTMP